MHPVSVGIYVNEEPERVAATLAALSGQTAISSDVLLLADGPGEATRIALLKMESVSISITEQAHGAAACFNRLLRERDASIYVFLEAGTRPASGCLDRLVAALDRNPRAGLAGPSTNRAWNQQCILPSLGGTEDDPENIGRMAARRFGQTCRTLEPLYSLGDFCYAVRRDVVDTIGYADEAYGTGPCWEMDYNIRAARAGFSGIWVCAAYVDRAPFTPRREREEREGFERSRHLYQDKFCGLRLRGLKSDYRSHCCGDACSNFAPRELVQIAAPRDGSAAPPIGSGHMPLVTCIMPTFNRRVFLPRALRCFLAQDYPSLELVIVDDGTDPISDLLPHDSRIRYFRLEEKQHIGSKRNFACEQARGEYIVHWDDDDWHAPDRVSRQISALREKGAHICGTSTMLYYRESTNQAFRYQYPGPLPMWMGTLAYPVEIWRNLRFEPIQIAEDVKFLARVPPRLRVDLRDVRLSISAIHDANASPKVTQGSCWSAAPVETLRAIAGEELTVQRSGPEVSCIMPTCNRRRFIPLALKCFASQTCLSKELIVVDDGEDSIADLLEGVPGVICVRLPRRMCVGAKRNIACEHAQGEYIAHWDDDDWHAPDRLQRQIEPLRAKTHDVTGLIGSYMLQMPDGQFWTITPQLHRKMFVGDIHGGTLVYRRALWQSGLRYPDADLAEDAAFIRRAGFAQQRIIRLENRGSFVYLRHERNTWKFTSGRFLDPSGWLKTAAPPWFPHELREMYKAASCGFSASSQMLPERQPGLCLV